MENATKALLIAAGMLLAILVTSLLVMFYNSLADYEQDKQNALTEAQIAQFNKEYEAYNREVSGFELLSLINKVLSYNAQNAISTDSGEDSWGYSNTSKGYTEMYMSINLKSSNALFTQQKYDTAKKKDKALLKGIRDDMKNLENKYGSSTMSKFQAISTIDYTKTLWPTDKEDWYKEDYEVTDQEKKDKELIEEIKKTVLGKDRSKIIDLNDTDKYPTISDVKKYQCYIEFKRGKFKCIGTNYDSKSNRIIKLEFEKI